MPGRRADALRSEMGDEAFSHAVKGILDDQVFQAVMEEIEYEAVESMINADDHEGRFVWSTYARTIRNVRDKLASYASTLERRARV